MSSGANVSGALQYRAGGSGTLRGLGRPCERSDGSAAVVVRHAHATYATKKSTSAPLPVT